jgi:proteasome regulatory subunit
MSDDIKDTKLKSKSNAKDASDLDLDEEVQNDDGDKVEEDSGEIEDTDEQVKDEKETEKTEDTSPDIAETAPELELDDESDDETDIDEQKDEDAEEDDDEDSEDEKTYNPWKEIAIRAECEKRFLENELKKLRNEVEQLYKEIKKIKMPPLIIGDIVEILSDDRVVVKSTTGPNFVVHVANFVDKSQLTVGSRVSLNRESLSVIELLSSSKDPQILGAEIIEKPQVSYNHIGGLTKQIEEIKESVELPLTKPDLFRKVGIDPPTGVLLIGSPGTGKTLLAQAVARHTNATFIRLVGSELVQKYIGEGSRLVRELFGMAKEKAPSIIFIDELDAIAAKRIDSGTSADREVQRTLMQLLAELDGFDPLVDVRIIGATNRPDILDDALLRPGRFDRIIEIPLPDYEARLEIFKIHSKNMNLDKKIDLEELAAKTEELTGADIKAICTEAGMFAIREEHYIVSKKNFKQSLEKILNSEKLKAREGGSRTSETGVMFA